MQFKARKHGEVGMAVDCPGRLENLCKASGDGMVSAGQVHDAPFLQTGVAGGIWQVVVESAGRWAVMPESVPGGCMGAGCEEYASHKRARSQSLRFRRNGLQ